MPRPHSLHPCCTACCHLLRCWLLKTPEVTFFFSVFCLGVYICMHGFTCVCAHTCGFECMSRPGIEVRNHPHWFFNFILWGRVSHSNPELTNMAVLLLASWPWVSTVSIFWGWSYRQTTAPTWHLHEFLGIQTLVLMSTYWLSHLSTRLLEVTVSIHSKIWQRQDQHFAEELAKSSEPGAAKWAWISVLPVRKMGVLAEFSQW